MSEPKLYLGDCLEVMKKIPDGSVDMVLCDLPYGTTACSWDFIIPVDALWEQYKRCVRPKGAILLFGSEPFSTQLRSSNLGQYRYDWYWDKKFAGNFVQAKRMPLKVIETISVFSIGGGLPEYFPIKTLRDKPIKKGKNSGDEAIPIRQTEHARTFDKKEYVDKHPTTLLEFSNRENRGLHPTQKPVSLCEYLIKTYTSGGMTVLDNCMGSGTTGVACINTGRNFIGIEQDEKYFNIAKARIELVAPKGATP